MKVVIFSPHGLTSPAHATTYMMLRYLHTLCAEVTQLHCNGAFSVCERDVSVNGGRTLDHCLKCSSEQRGFVDFSGGASRKVTDFLKPEDLEQTRQWTLERQPEEIWNDEWYGISLQSLISETFHRFTGEAKPRFSSQRHGQLVRQLALVAMRMTVAGGRCINQMKPDWVWIASGTDLLSRSFREAAGMRAAALRKTQVVTFQSLLSDQMVLAQREGDSHPYRIQNVVDSLENVRSDIESWPKEVLSEFDEFLRFLGISSAQLSLPVAR